MMLDSISASVKTVGDAVKDLSYRFHWEAASVSACTSFECSLPLFFEHVESSRCCSLPSPCELGGVQGNVKVKVLKLRELGHKCSFGDLSMFT
jgi:hypothetical protein